MVFLYHLGDINAQVNNDIVLSYQDFMSMVKQHHPLAKQAENYVNSAEAFKLSKQGNFDPKLFYELKNKFFDDKNYYQIENGGIQIPTWYGVNLKAGLEQNQGVFLNPENQMPENGLIYSNISFPLLQGLIIDERRAALKQANLFVEMSEQEKVLALNELLFKAGKSYLDWSLAYQKLLVHENALTLSKERFEAVKNTVKLGDKPAIDSVEANIQVQDRTINVNQAKVEYVTQSLLLSNFLWKDGTSPIEITERTTPSSWTAINPQNMDNYLNKLENITENHPTLKLYDYKIKQLTIDKKLKQDKLKPSLNLNYNPLFNNNNFNVNSLENYKWGVSIGFPIFLRKERGELQMAKIKLENMNLETTYKKNELINQIKNALNVYANFSQQVTIFSSNVENYNQLWNAEKKLFELGESSLFMINSRELSYINAQLKLNDIIYKNKKSALDIEYNFGQLSTIY